MYTHRVEVFHIADGDAVALGIAHHLVFNFLPARDTALNEHLPHAGKADAVVRDLAQFLFIIRDAAAGAAKLIGRADDDRITDGGGEFQRILHRFHHLGGNARLADGKHGIFKRLPVLRLLDRICVNADQPHTELLQDALLLELHGEVQARLSAQGGQDGIGLLHLQHAAHGWDGQRLNVDLIRNVFIRHDRGGVGVNKHNLHALLMQGAAGLRAGIVKLRRLADDDGAGTDDKDFFNALIDHCSSSFSIMRINLSNRNDVSCGPGEASGWN